MTQFLHALRRLIGRTLLAALLICCLTDVACSEDKSGSVYDVTLRRLDRIPPGTVIGKEAPKGWSNLILKSYSKPGAGDMKQLSPIADRLSRLLFTALIADVKSDETADGKRHKLAKVAVGLGVRIRDKNTVVTPDTQRKFGANLGLLARVVLRTAEEKLDEIAVVARSDTMMVFDSPSLLLVDRKHKPIVLRYAVLVERKSGRLNALVWALGREEGGKYSDPIGPIHCLPANLTDDCLLHVDGSEFSLGQPTEKAFAMTTPPKGRKDIEAGDDLRPLAARPRFSTASAAELESKLRKALQRAAEK